MTTEPSLHEKVQDIIRSYDAAESLARQMAERNLDALGLRRITVTPTEESREFRTRLIQTEMQARYAEPEPHK